MSGSVADPGLDPWPSIRQWLADAADEPSGHEMVLATATPQGVPSARVVSLRGVDARGLRFFTHDGSRKTRELAANPEVAVVFHWPRLHRQLRVDGRVHALPRPEVEAYFATRPRAAQIAAWVSRQGTRAEHDVLRAEADALAPQTAAEPLGCPPDFVGYVIAPRAVELWSGASDRLHRRTCFLLRSGVWDAFGLAP